MARRALLAFIAGVLGVVGPAPAADAAVRDSEAAFCRYLQESGLDEVSIYATGSCEGGDAYIPLSQFRPGTALADVLGSAADGDLDRNFLLWAPEITTAAPAVKQTTWSHCAVAHTLGTACPVGNSTFAGAYTPAYDFDGAGRFRVGRDGVFVGMFCANFSQHDGRGRGPVPRIEGTKYEDLDGDGRRDTGEPGVGGFTIELWQKGARLASTTTDAAGHYAFELDAERNHAISDGTFSLREVQKDGWVQSQAPEDVTVGLAQGGVAREVGDRVVVDDRVFSGRDFGNYRPVTVAGAKVEDMDADGSPAGDPGVAGWGVTVTGPDGVVTRTTDADGAFSVGELRPGTYTVTEESRAGWTQSFPASGSYTVTLRSGESATDAVFANWRPATISGRKFQDLAVDGVGTGDPGLAAWTIRADGDREVTTTTGDGGGYVLDGLRPGRWTVEEVQQDGWRQSAPTSGTYEVTLRSGMTVLERDFGNVCLGGVDVTVADTSTASVHAPLETRIVEVDVPGILENDPALPRSTDTGSFDGLLPGVYDVVVFLPDDVYSADEGVEVVDGRWAVVERVTVEQCDRAAATVEVFTGSRGKITGGMKEVQVGGYATAGGVFMTKSGQPTGSLEFNDHVQPFSVHTSDIRGIWVDDSLTNAWVWGVVELDGESLRFRLHLVDAGEPGTSDRYELDILDRYSAGAGDTIIGGNIQIHQT